MTSLFLLSVIPIPAVANEVAIDNVLRLRHHLPSSSPHNRVPVLSYYVRVIDCYLFCSEPTQKLL